MILCITGCYGEQVTGAGLGERLAALTPDLLPTSWPGFRQLTGRQLADALPTARVRLNPGARVSVTIPLADVAGSAGDSAL